MGKLKTHEEFVKEIKDRFNGNIVILDKYIDQKTKIRFYCSQCNNQWTTTPMSILHTSIGCPVCANKITSQKLTVKNIETTGKFIDLYPELAKMIDYEKNKDIHIENLTAHSGKYVWWKCDVCGYSWQSQIANMTKNKGNCPECYRQNMTNNVINHRLQKDGSLADNYSDLLNEWNYEKNKDLNPSQVLSKSNKKVWWKCAKCGREWQAKISKRTSGENCPYCYRFEKSNLQKKVQNYIETNYCYNMLHEHDCTLKCRNPKTNHLLPYDNELIIDDNTRLIIECHGEQHYKICGLTKLAAKKENITPEEVLEYVQWKDKYKKDYAISQGYHYLDIPYSTESDNSYKTLIDNKIQEILSTIQN